MKKLISVLLICFSFTAALFSNSFDIEFPFKIEILKTENEIDYNYTDTKFLKFPLPFFGPVRAGYTFEKPESNWSFGTGGSFYVYPFQTVSVYGSASYKLKTLKNGTNLELKNIVDLGLFMHFKGYYNVNKGNRDTLCSVSPFFEYSPMLIFNKEKCYWGFGPDIAGACDQKIVKIYYGFNFNIGFKIYNIK